MGLDRDDFYEECKNYCRNIELLDIVDDMVFDCKYNEMLDEDILLQIKSFLIKQIEFTEKKRVGWVLRS